MSPVVARALTSRPEHGVKRLTFGESAAPRSPLQFRSLAESQRVFLMEGCRPPLPKFLQQLQAPDDRFARDVDEVFDLEAALEQRSSLGGTAPSAVKAQLDAA